MFRSWALVCVIVLLFIDEPCVCALRRKPNFHFQADQNRHLSQNDTLTFKTLTEINVLKLVRIIQQNYDISDVCKEDLSQWAAVVANGKFTDDDIWALSMLDSSALIPTGLLTGSIWHLGHFDECLAVKHPDNNFIGQHCMLKIVITADNNSYEINYGVCLPSTCSAEDINVEFSTQTYIMRITTKEDKCKTILTENPLDDGDWAVISVLIVIVLGGIIISLYHVYKIYTEHDEPPDFILIIFFMFTIYLITKNIFTKFEVDPNLECPVKLHPLLQSFSLINNWHNLFTISSDNEQMACLHGLRTISIAWIVLGHTYSQFAYMPTINLTDMLDEMDNVNYMLLWNVVFSVDTFLFMSGLLVVFVFFRDFQRKSYFDLPVSYLHRYLRLTPSYLVVILVAMTIFRRFGSGPLWTTEPCVKNWWASILYINNYFDPETACMSQTWYLSVDMQLFWISPILLVPFLISPKFATVLLVFLTIGSAVLNFLLDLNVEGLSYNLGLSNSEQEFEDYVPTYTRASPWLIGATLAVITVFLKKSKQPAYLPEIVVVFGWLFSTLVCLGCLYSPIRFMYGADATATEIAAYVAFSRFGWGCGLAWIVFACVHDYGGLANNILSLGIFQPLGKLSYGVYLIHISVQMYRIRSLRSNSFAGPVELAYFFIADYVLSNILALLLYLFVEAPVSALDRFYLRKIKLLPFPMKKATRKTHTP